MEELYNKIEPQMLLKKTIQKTKNFLHKTPRNLKSFLFGGHHKLPKAARHFNPFFSGSKRISKSSIPELDDFYRNYYQQRHQLDHNDILDRKNSGKNTKKSQGIAEVECSESQRKIAVRFGMKDIERESRKEEEKKGREILTRSTSKGSLRLLQKMEELEMMDREDVDHELDIEEVLHYYSLLNSPVYVDIVDRFFLDMYTEFSIPKPSGSLNNSMRTLGPLKL
ncbi:uncharacterized protein LOC107815365 [Nicotiana tabacum]|uniref:Uncharacterized protein LOC107815365 n=2 Tax=Nicotiana tabacum TaxID=4097 RepID=A0A1S4C5E3_TOBAC|nr:uncharacterized protein LOC104105219 [Nicotiana tomentosiformis]XP_009611767.1 uncharacterized protein LOC104105219 [Nicotiana tomentosiformis]XP_016496422.1 PREDICTED: uncharacterized protein LOC107815365 [Nicotiana tabacum]